MCGISNFSCINVTKTAAVKAISSLYTIVKILEYLGWLFTMIHQKLFIKLHLSMSVDAEEIHVRPNQELPGIIKENEEVDPVVFTMR